MTHFGGVTHLHAGLCLALGGIGAALLLHTTADPDLWGHLAVGRLTLAHGLPRTDPFSYTAAGAPFVDHEWLSDLVTYACFRLAGPAGLIGWRLLLLASMLALVAAAVRRARGGPLATVATLTVVVVGTFPWLVTVRPQLYTFVFFAALLLALVRADAGDRRPLACTPALTVLWVNLHGGIVAGLGVLGLWGGLRLAQASAVALGRPLRGVLGRGTPAAGAARMIALVLALHVAAALLNPYGLTLWRFFAETLTVRRAEITEWQPVTPTNLGDLLGLAALAALGLWIATSRRARDPVQLATLGLLVVAALGARRHLALAVIAGAVFGAPHVAEAFAHEAAGSRAGGAPRALLGGTLAVVASLVVAGLGRARCVTIEPGTVPRAAVEYLKAARVEGKLAVLFDWGEYVIWHLAPQVRVSIDGRRETVYSPALLAENAAFLYGRPDWRDGLDRDRVDVALMSPRFAAYERLSAAADWRLAFADASSGLFVRRGSAAEAALARTTPSPASAADALCLGRAG